MRFAITGTDARFLPLRKLLLADGHEITDPASADMVISPPWDPSARYARREEYQIAIARLTAEGAIALLRPETGLSGAHILLLGYGRIARLLARELQKAGALVTAAARSGEQRAWAEAEGIEALPLDALSGALDRFDVIIGTIPAPVLTEPLLALVRKDALLLELASAPGGIDAAAAHERGLRYIRAPGLPAKYAPERAAVILRDAVYAAAAEPLPRLGLAVTGSHCTFSRALEAFRPLKRDYTLVPILSGAAAGTDTRFFAASAFRAELEAFCGREAVDTFVKAEPLGTAQRLDALLVAPCTGNTLAKLARGVTDTAVTMACKAHLRNGAPLILAISTNDGLSGSAESIAALLQRKNVYFVPFRQDAPHQKPFSLQSDFDLLGETIKAAMEGRQLQPVLL
ncbi:MAG: dipicolinate synthase subunit B [Christensenellaceae bacterium]